MYVSFGKRLFDLILAVAGLIILSPLFLFLTLLILCLNQTTPFFCQPRPGLNGKIFTIIKFRTMMDLYDGNRQLLPDSQRLTLPGKFLRKTSLDELPQLWNVLRGDMSLVGPRPLLKEYLPLYTKTQLRRHAVKPGITGWAQINGRNRISWEEKFARDLWYVDHISFRIDLLILFSTVKALLLKKPVYGTEKAMAEKFAGQAIQKPL